MWTTLFLLANIPRLFNVGNHEEIIGNTKTLDWCLIPVGTVLFVPIIFEVQCPWNRLSIANILVIQAKCTTSTPFHQESTKKPPRIICSVCFGTTPHLRVVYLSGDMWKALWWWWWKSCVILIPSNCAFKPLSCVIEPLNWGSVISICVGNSIIHLWIEIEYFTQSPCK